MRLILDVRFCGQSGNFMLCDVVELVQELVRRPSVNPMGRAVAGDDFCEYRVTAYLEEFFRAQGWAYQRQFVHERRENIIARIDGLLPPEQGGKILLFEAHQDTVPFDGMTISPTAAELKNGRVYGRGACDIKGGMASMLAAVARLATEKPASYPTIIMACTVNEEHGFTGAKALAQVWQSPEAHPLQALIPRRPDAAIVAEPTLLNVVAAHKGMVRWRCHVQGRAGHSSQPELAENAIYRMADVLHLLERYAREEVGKLSEHRLVGRPTLSVGTIHGGISVNTVPDHCTIEIDRRIVPVPPESPLAAQRHVVEYLQQHLSTSVQIQHDTATIHSPGLTDQRNGAIAEQLSAVARQYSAPGDIMGVPYGTDAPAYDATGVPTVVFGPGSIAQAHTCDEWVEIEQLRAASEIYYQFALNFANA